VGLVDSCLETIGDARMTLGFRPIVFFLGFLLPVVLAACNNVGETFRLEADESYRGGQHLVVVNVDLERDSRVRGDMGITAADEVNIDGHVDGDLTVVAKKLTIGADAQISGDLNYCLVGDSDLQIDEAAVIWGEVRECNDATLQVTLSSNRSANYFLRFVGNVALSLIVGLLAALGTIFFPGQLAVIRRTAYRQRWTSVGLGVLTLIVAMGLFSLWRLSLAIVVPIILAPGVVVGGLALMVMAGAGMISVAQPPGRWLMRRLRLGEQIPIVSSTVGSVLLTFAILSFRIVPALGFITALLMAVLASWALGAALLTRAGTR
jgi:hypothetical protein